MIKVKEFTGDISKKPFSDRVSILLEILQAFNMSDIAMCDLRTVFPELDRIVDISTSMDNEGNMKLHEVNAAQLMELHIKAMVVLLKKSQEMDEN